MRLDIVGSAGSYPGPGVACSSYLVTEANYKILLDAGNGSMANLFGFTTPDLLDAVVITHEHTDHLADFVGIFHYRRYASTPERKLQLFCTKGALKVLTTLITDSSLGQGVDVHLLHEGFSIRLGPFDLSVARTAHPVETYGIRLTGKASCLVYTADTGPCLGIEGLAHNADVLLAESTWVEERTQYPKNLHLTVADAVRLAEVANAKHLVLTHVAYPNSPWIALAQAKLLSPDLSVDIAVDRASFEVDKKRTLVTESEALVVSSHEKDDGTA